jgi:hypothetical protein
VGWFVDNFTPMWIVGFIVLAVAAIVVLVFFQRHVPGDSLRDTIGASPFTLLSTGVWLSWGSARDLVDGPVVLHGKNNLSVEKLSGGARGGASIWASLVLLAPDGTVVPIDMRGWGAEKGEDFLASCNASADVEVTVLRHTERVLAVRCQ